MHFARRGIVEFTWLIVLRALRAELSLIRELETLGLVSHRLVTQVFILQYRCLAPALGHADRALLLYAHLIILHGSFVSFAEQPVLNAAVAYGQLGRVPV